MQKFLPGGFFLGGSSKWSGSWGHCYGTLRAMKKSHQVKIFALGLIWPRMTPTMQKWPNMDLPRQFQVSWYLAIIPPDYYMAGQNGPNVLKNLCYPAFWHFSKKIGVLAARFGAMTFTRALGYAKRPLLRAPDIAGSRPRHICTINSINVQCT